MATLRQDVWFGESPRLSGLRLGPFRDARVRVLLHPHRATPMISSRLVTFAERLAERVEVVLLNPRTGPSDPQATSVMRDDFARVIQCVEELWRDRLPLVLAGAGLGGALALDLAGHPAVRAVVALAPFVPPQTPWPVAAGADCAAGFAPVSLERPALIVAPRDEPRLDRPQLEAARLRWSQATWITPPGAAPAALAPVWAATAAEWTLGAVQR